jgi:hypothetical protein
MKIKLARGPMANKRVTTTDPHCYRYEVAAPVKVDWAAYQDYPYRDDYWSEPIREKRGHYERSNVTLKDGTVVFEWMGWRQ